MEDDHIIASWHSVALLLCVVRVSLPVVPIICRSPKLSILVGYIVCVQYAVGRMRFTDWYATDISGIAGVVGLTALVAKDDKVQPGVLKLTTASYAATGAGGFVVSAGVLYLHQKREGWCHDPETPSRRAGRNGWDPQCPQDLLFRLVNIGCNDRRHRGFAEWGQGGNLLALLDLGTLAHA